MHTEIERDWGLGWLTAIDPYKVGKGIGWRPSLTSPSWDWSIEGAGGPHHMSYSGFVTSMIYDKSIEIGVIMLLNQDIESCGFPAIDILDLLYQSAYQIVDPSAPRPQLRTFFPTIPVLLALSLMAVIVIRQRRQNL